MRTSLLLSLPLVLLALGQPLVAVAADDTADSGTDDTGDGTSGSGSTSDDDEPDVPTFTASDAAGEDGGCSVVSVAASGLSAGLAMLVVGWRRED